MGSFSRLINQPTCVSHKTTTQTPNHKQYTTLHNPSTHAPSSTTAIDATPPRLLRVFRGSTRVGDAARLERALSLPLTGAAAAAAPSPSSGSGWDWPPWVSGLFGLWWLMYV